MKLFGSYTSPYVRHCRIVLLETGVDCEFVETDMKGAAKLSATQRVPFFEDGEISLTDSSSIVRYLREKSNQGFLIAPKEYDLYCMVNTILDTTINLFLLDKTGQDAGNNSYLRKQRSRIKSSLTQLEQADLSANLIGNDLLLRLVCFLAWTQFRDLLDLRDYPKLTRLLKQASSYDNFTSTHPA